MNALDDISTVHVGHPHERAVQYRRTRFPWAAPEHVSPPQQEVEADSSRGNRSPVDHAAFRSFGGSPEAIDPLITESKRNAARFGRGELFRPHGFCLTSPQNTLALGERVSALRAGPASAKAPQCLQFCGGWARHVLAPLVCTFHSHSNPQGGWEALAASGVAVTTTRQHHASPTAQ